MLQVQHHAGFRITKCNTSAVHISRHFAFFGKTKGNLGLRSVGVKRERRGGGGHNASGAPCSTTGAQSHVYYLFCDCLFVCGLQLCG